MENKNVGFLIVGISLIVFLIIGIFNYGLKKIVSQTCTMGPTCTMYDTITIQTLISIAIAGLILIIGFFFIFAKEPEKIIIKKIKEKKKEISMENLDKEEKTAVKLLQEEN